MSDYLLADDLSGALEAGAAFRARGRRVTLPLAGGLPVRAGELRVLSTETRNARPAEAARTVGTLLAVQQAAGAHLLFKKIDSTLRGPVGAEIKALVETLVPPLIVVCPATPAAGRTVCAGVLHVHGVRLTETEFRQDPGWPATESRVGAVLEAAGVKPAGVLSLAELRGDGEIPAALCRGVLVSDAETDNDLRRLVERVKQVEPAAVFVGGGGLAHAVAAATAGANAAAERLAPASVLFVSGSLSERSRRQLENLRDEHGVPLHEIGPVAGAPEEIAQALARSLATGRAAALTLARGGGKLDAKQPLAWLGAVVQALFKQGQGPAMLAATGGETARLLCTVSGVTELELVGEFEPGVVLASVVAAEAPQLRWVVIKPGGFGAEDVWVKVLSGYMAG